MSEQLYTKQQITDFQINHSSAKQMYSFSKAERFPPVKRSGCDKFFLLPPIKHSRCAGFGFGNKYDFTKVKKGNNPEFYSVKRDFDKDNLKGPCYSFGAARETYEKVYYETNKTVDKNIPGPGKYLPKPIKTAPSYTIGVRDKSFGQTSRRARDGPGPGAYPPAIQINQQGKYPSSRFKNITSLSFGSPTSQRFKYKASAGHGDFLGSDIGWGKHFNSKYKSSHDAVILGRPKEHDSRTNYPGPGAYMVFSEFSIYGPKRKKKVEKKEENEYQENEEEKVSDHDNEDHKQEEENQQQEDKAKSENEQKENENENKKEENINDNKDEQQVEEKENDNKDEQQIEEKTNDQKEEQQIEEKENTKNDEQHVEEKQNENQNEPQIEEKANNKKDNEPIEGEYQDNEENNNAN